MKQNFYSFSLFFFFWMHITFQYLRILEGKRFELYLSLTGSQFSDFFLSFLWVSVFPRAGWPQRSGSIAGFIQTKILLQISLMHNGLFGAKSLWTNHLTFPLLPPHRVTPLDWPRLLSFNKLKGTECRSLDLSFYYHFKWSVLMLVDSNKEG